MGNKLKLTELFLQGWYKINDLRMKNKFVDTHRESHSSRIYICNGKIFCWPVSYTLSTQWHKPYTQRKPACHLKIKEPTGFRPIGRVRSFLSIWLVALVEKRILQAFFPLFMRDGLLLWQQCDSNHMTKPA